MATNNRPLKAYVRFDGSGRIVAGSLILRKSKPKVGKWQEIPAFECCNTPPAALCSIGGYWGNYTSDEGVDSYVTSQLDDNCNTYALFKMTNSDSLLVKFDSSGNLLWQVEVDTAEAVYTPTAFEVANNYAYVAGRQGIIKFDSNGNIVWNREYDIDTEEYEMEGIKVDGLGNIFIIFRTTSDGAFLCKLTSLGNVDTTLFYNPDYPGADGIGAYGALSIDSSNNVWVPFWITTAGEVEYYTNVVKFDNNLNYITDIFNDTSVGDGDATNLVVNSNGIYFNGWDKNLYKFDSSGNNLWWKSYTGLLNYSGNAFDVADDGSVIWVAENDVEGESSLIISKFSSSGTHQWSYELFNLNESLTLFDISPENCKINGGVMTIISNGTVLKLPLTKLTAGVYNQFEVRNINISFESSTVSTTSIEGYLSNLSISESSAILTPSDPGISFTKSTF